MADAPGPVDPKQVREAQINRGVPPSAQCMLVCAT